MSRRDESRLQDIVEAIDAIREHLTRELKPVQIEVVNESHLHAGHRSSPGTGDSHFRIRVVSPAFEGLSRVARQRLVNAALAELMGYRERQAPAPTDEEEALGLYAPAQRDAASGDGKGAIGQGVGGELMQGQPYVLRGFRLQHDLRPFDARMLADLWNAPDASNTGGGKRTIRVSSVTPR